MTLPDPVRMRLNEYGDLLIPAGRDFIEAAGVPTDGLVLNAPLYHPDLSVDPGGGVYSMDDYRHLCTVTGALWTPQGRTFDGDDYIDSDDSIAITGNADRTTALWVHWTTGGGGQFFSCGVYSIRNHYGLRITGAGALQAGFHTSNHFSGLTAPSGEYSFVAHTWKGDTQTSTLYLNGSSEALGLGVNLNTSASIVRLGALSASFGGHWVGREGEVYYADRVLSATELEQMRLATKWRYS